MYGNQYQPYQPWNQWQQPYTPQQAPYQQQLPQFANSTVQTSAIGYDGAGGIQLKAPGTYKVDVNITTTATAADSQEFQLFADGNPVAGAAASTTASAIGDEVSVAFSALETVLPGVGGYATLTVVSAGATSVDIAQAIVEKVQ